MKGNNVKKIITEKLGMLDAGMITGDEFVAELRELVRPLSRLEYVRQHLSYDPITNQIFNRKTKKPVGTGGTVHVGEGISPVNFRRAVWFLVGGTDPHYVGWDTEGIFAVEEQGGERIRAAS